MERVKETRSFICEVRAEQDEQRGAYITGTPIVFDQWTDLGWYREMIRASALVSCDLKDVRFLTGHNTSMVPLARSRNNNENSTMQLKVTETGMEIRVNLDIENNVEARALYSAIARGDITGMSFMMIVDKDKDVWTDIESNYPSREITCILRVLEVSAVAFPAYEQTSIQVASQDDALDSARASLESAKKRLAEERAAQEAAKAAEEAARAEQERRTAALERLNNLITEVSDHV